MPSPTKATTTPRAGRVTQTVRSADEAGEARRLFENRLVHVSLRLPKTMTQTAEIEFDISMQDLVANALAGSDALAEALESQRRQPEAEGMTSRPSPRLSRAMASAEKIKRGRFADADEMFDALVEATRG